MGRSVAKTRKGIGGSKRWKRLSRCAGIAGAFLVVFVPNDLFDPMRKLVVVAAELPHHLSSIVERSQQDRRNRHYSDPVQLALGGQLTGPFAPGDHPHSQSRTRKLPADNVVAANDAPMPPGFASPGNASGGGPATFSTYGAPPPAAPGTGGGPGNPISGTTPPSSPGQPSPPGQPPGQPSPPDPPSTPGQTPGQPSPDQPSAPHPDGPAAQPPPAVPEPLSWITMIVGFAALGTVLRRGHRALHRVSDDA
jgi:hypothetical protein